MTKISFGPEGPNWIHDHFVQHIIDPLQNAGLIKWEDPVTKNHVAAVCFLKDGEWIRQPMGHEGRKFLAEFAQSHGLPMTIEDDEVFYIMPEKDAVLEYLKYGS